jgi:hypothetical protein
MYQELLANEEAFLRLSGLQVNEFEVLYRDFMAVWRKLKAERSCYAGRQVVSGAGRKFLVSPREQLLAVLIWSHLGLHPQSISQLLDIHVSTFARIRQRVLTILSRLNVAIEIPNRKTYKETNLLSETYPELIQLG